VPRGAERAAVFATAPTLVALAILVGAAGQAPGEAAPQHQKLVDGTVAFLQGHQLESGAYADAGRQPSQSISAWATLAVAAAGVNPLDQTRTVNGVACGHSAFEDLEEHLTASLPEEVAWPEVGTTTFERELLVVDAAGTDPHDFAGYDLVAEILARQKSDGGIPFVPGGEGQINDAVFGILALSPIEEPGAEAAVQAAARWLLSAQGADGGWNWLKSTATSEVDLTGAALEALAAAGMRGTEAEARALEYLHRAQRPDGGFAEYPSSEAESNVASTAWAVQGIWAGGGDPETWTIGTALPPAEPLDYMESMQQPDGHIRWRASSDQNGIWMTAYVMPAFAGRTLPYPPPASSGRSGSERPPCEAIPKGPDPPSSGPTGGSPAPSAEGVGAGGGGGGAPDFSRPEPGSRGRTPGGARVVRHEHGERARNRSRNRRGANQRQASGTETAEPRTAAEADQDVAAVSAEATGPIVAAATGGE
jgi:hypothetical protein